MSEIIGITATSGNLGGSVLKHLLKTLHYPPSNIIISTSNVGKVDETITDLGVKVRYGNYLEPEKLSFSGIDKLLIISYPSMAHEIRVTAHKNALNAAAKDGVKQVYYTSLAFNGNPTESPVMFAHRDSEAYIKELYDSKRLLNYTIIREGIYSESFYLYFGYWNRATAIEDFLKVKEIVTCSKGGIAYASIDDLGEATARIILDGSNKYDQKLILLSGEKSVSQTELASIIESTLKEPIGIKYVTGDEYIRYHSKHSDVEILKKAVIISSAIDKGEASVVSSHLHEILGRKPKSIKETVEEVFQGNYGINPDNEKVPE